jgi:hypothetical protein
MDSDELLAIWDAQLALFSKIAAAAGIEARGEVGYRAAALAVAESLIQLPTVEAANDCIESDKNGARCFLHQAYELDWLINDTADMLLKSYHPIPSAPFYVLGTAVRQLLTQLRKASPEAFDGSARSL